MMATTLSTGAFLSGAIVISGLRFRESLLSLEDTLPRVALEPLYLYVPRLEMVISGILVSSVETAVLSCPGNFRFNAFGVTKLDVSIKKINSKKIMSVNDDMLKVGSIFDLFFSPMVVILALLWWQ